MGLKKSEWPQSLGPYPHSGGDMISPNIQERTRKRLLSYAASHYHGKYRRIDIRFQRQFCYIDALLKLRNPRRSELSYFNETAEEYRERVQATPLPLCRLRYFATLDKWSVAYWVPHLRRYEPCVFLTGKPFGTPQQGFDVGATHL